MPDGTHVADIADVPTGGSYRFTAEDAFTNEREVILVHCEEEIRAWVNTCTHETQKFDHGSGAPMREGQIICPKHGSLFDACTGECDNGEAAGTTLPAVEITVADGGERAGGARTSSVERSESDGGVFLTDDDYIYLRDGGINDENGPSSTSHLSL